jgi:8-hydroxy-5-deazaflavin:NADPH oxidoreductase
MGPLEQEQQVTDTVGILGGTGGLGKGLAARWVRAGTPVILGSRSPERAANAAQEVAGWLEGEDHAELRGEGNAGAAAADLVVASVPFDGLAEGLEPLTAALAGKIVVSVVNPLGFDQRGAHPLPVAEGSAAEAVEALLPGARVTAAFHSVSSVALRQLGQPMDDDVPVVGDDEEAVARTVALADRIDGVRAFPAGPLRLAAPLEALTPVLITINQRHRCHVGVRFSRLEC